MQLASVLVIAAVAGLIWWLSLVRTKWVQKHTDAFAKAFCEAADHNLPGGAHACATLRLNYERSDSGMIRVLADEDQPEGLRQMFKRGVDDYTMDRIRIMFEERAQAQARLTSINLIGGKYNAVLNRCYTMTNQFYLFVKDRSQLKTQEDLELFQIYLQKQDYLRNTTLASIVSDACRQSILIP